MQAQSCPWLLNEVIAIKRALSMHIRFVKWAHAVRQTDSVLFAVYVVPITASTGDVLASILCRLFYRYRGKYLHKLHPFLIAFLAVLLIPVVVMLERPTLVESSLGLLPKNPFLFFLYQDLNFL